MEDFWLSVADEIPALAVILLFLIYERRTQSASIERNHGLWQQWLEKRDMAAAEERRAWQEWIHARDSVRNEEHRQMIAALANLQAEMHNMSNAVLLRFVMNDPETARAASEAIRQAQKKD